jgi:hypothetical protein
MGLEGSHIFEDLEIVDHVFVLSIDGINDGKNSRNVFVEMVSNIVKSCEHLVHVTILDLSLGNNDDWVLFTGASDVFSEESVLAVLEAELSLKPAVIALILASCPPKTGPEKGLAMSATMTQDPTFYAVVGFDMSACS